jgi:hypothetical protein
MKKIEPQIAPLLRKLLKKRPKIKLLPSTKMDRKKAQLMEDIINYQFQDMFSQSLRRHWYNLKNKMNLFKNSFKLKESPKNKICIRCGKSDWKIVYWFDNITLSHQTCRNCFAIYRYTTMNQAVNTEFKSEAWEL